MSKDKMSKDKMLKDKMSNNKMSKDKKAKDKMSKDKKSKQLLKMSNSFDPSLQPLQGLSAPQGLGIPSRG
jgi:hypothetical protein